MEVITPEQISQLTDAQLLEYDQKIADWEKDDRKEHPILYYNPVSPQAAKIHSCTAKTIGVGGGNRASKTDTVLAEFAALCTGILPYSLRDDEGFVSKFIGPIQARVVCESITTTLGNVILRKLKYFSWNGKDDPGRERLHCLACKWDGQLKRRAERKCPGCQSTDLLELPIRGHYGWIPKHCLIDQKWESSWKEKERTLTVLCHDPDRPDEVLGRSTIQFMSKDQDPEDHASGEFHLLLMDEAPSEAIFDESVARVMSVGGRLYLSMTWADDPGISQDYIYDKIYEKGIPGPAKDPNTAWFNLYTTDNPNIDQREVSIRVSQMSEEMKQVRIYGQSIRFSSRVHPLFTDQTQQWCTTCRKVVIAEKGSCTTCMNTVVDFCHVQGFDAKPAWPVANIVDPHPRRPHMGLLVQIDPSDDWWVLDELIVAGDPVAYKEELDVKERAYQVRPCRWLMDPNMGGSPAGANREVTWQTEFQKAGLPFDLADDGAPGRALVDDRLKVDAHTYKPRLIIHPRCTTTILQLKRYAWDDYRDRDKRGMKQKASDKHSDMPTLLKYLANDFPTFQGYRGMGVPVQYGGQLDHGYFGGTARAAW